MWSQILYINKAIFKMDISRKDGHCEEKLANIKASKPVSVGDRVCTPLAENNTDLH